MSRHQKQRKKPMNDLISRQAVIDAILGITPMRNTIPLDSAIFNIEKLPSAEPELKHGKLKMTNYEWIKSLSVDEMAELLYQSKEYGCETVNIPNYEDCSGDCRQCLLVWLQQEHKEGS